MKEKQKEKRLEGESNILVAIRIRPLNQKQVNNGDLDIVRSQDNLIIILDPKQAEYEMDNKKMLDVLHRSKEQRYAFDKIYSRQQSELIYQQTTQSLVKTVLTGKNATVFAYGPTGTGKTYTMLGNQQVYGLNVLAIRDIFRMIEVDSEYNYRINITYVQIYNQMIRDLLVPASNYLQLRDDNDKGVSIAGVTEFQAQSTQQVMELLLIGNKRRTTQATNANQTSSRSHAVFQINVIKTPRTRNINVETLAGKLSLIDLAGSERGTVTQNRGIRLMQGAKINRSLLALANCINALGDKNKKGFFVPYRDSKLTRLLKDSLGGNSKTVMIANISPAGSQFQQTINTLKYANRAKNIKTKPLTNKKLVSIHISEYKSIINDLRQEIQQLKTKLQKNQPLNIIEGNFSQQKYPEKNQMCTCGRLEQNQEIKKIKQKIFENFNERIQFRKALMEIEQQNVINIAEINKKRKQIQQLKQQQNEQTTAQHIKHLTKTIHTLKLSTQKNILKKQITNIQLTQSMSITKKIRQQIPRKVKTKQNRQFLEILIKNHILELQNIQLEINLQVQDKILGDLQKLSVGNKEVLESNGVSFIKLDQEQMEDDVGNKDQIQLELEEEEDGDNQYQDLQQQAELQQSIRQVNEDAHRKIIQQSYEQRYGDQDFQEQPQQKPSSQQQPQQHKQEEKHQQQPKRQQPQQQQQIMQQFSDNHLEQSPLSVQQQHSEQDIKNDVSRKFLKKELRIKKQQKSMKNMNINYSMGNMEARISEELEQKKKISHNGGNNLQTGVNKNQVGIELGVVGFKSIGGVKKRQKTLTNQYNTGNSSTNKSPTSKMIPTISNTNISLKQQPTENKQPLEFNLKGINLRLNEKMPFTMAPKEKKKRI